ncbi:polyphosphate polymerase domain-containing protein [Kribbella sp. NPDC056345]|uniref:polyphosphate polymerase domain-containing protein n=1 Tax=Kribbella sp. NPDC056345 TaxID=3345789 RepID=UPI0035D92395
MSTTRTAAAMAGALEPFPVITLPEVLAEAALQVRVDRKYLVPLETFVELTARLRATFAALWIDGRCSFRYESVYFDTADHELYRQHLQGRRRRYKLRTRAYLDSGECSLEIKLKGARSETIKSRVDYPLPDRARLTPPAWDFVTERLQTEYGVPPEPRLGPALATTYRRSTLVDPVGHARLTCDTDLRFSAPGHSVQVRPDVVLVESKTAGRAGTADDVLRELGVRPISVSKYCVAVALLNPRLRANPWHRTLQLFR